MLAPKLRILLGASALVFAAVAPAAFGQNAGQLSNVTVSPPGSNDDVISVVVNFADLNLNSRPGAEALAHRLHWAVRRACDGDNVNLRDLATVSQFRSCYEAAMWTAVKRIDNPLVSAAAGLPASTTRMAAR